MSLNYNNDLSYFIFRETVHAENVPKSCFSSYLEVDKIKFLISYSKALTIRAEISSNVNFRKKIKL